MKRTSIKLEPKDFLKQRQSLTLLKKISNAKKSKKNSLQTINSKSSNTKKIFNFASRIKSSGHISMSHKSQSKNTTPIQANSNHTKQFKRASKMKRNTVRGYLVHQDYNNQQKLKSKERINFKSQIMADESIKKMT